VAFSTRSATALTEEGIIFLPDGARVALESGATVLALSARTATPLRTVCGGIGTCTACRVQVVAGEWPAGRADRDRLGGLVGEGWRLACQFSPRRPLTVRRPAVVS
jgi:ferredoxin